MKSQLVSRMKLSSRSWIDSYSLTWHYIIIYIAADSNLNADNGDKKKKLVTDSEEDTAMISEQKKQDAETSHGSLNLPDLCMERRCCEGETCEVRRDERSREPLAICVSVSVLFFNCHHSYLL